MECGLANEEILDVFNTVAEIRLIQSDSQLLVRLGMIEIPLKRFVQTCQHLFQNPDSRLLDYFLSAETPAIILNKDIPRLEIMTGRTIIIQQIRTENPN